MDLCLRRLRHDDERAVRAAHETMAAEGNDFTLGLDASASWAEYLSTLDDFRHGRALPPGHVASTFLVVDVDGVIVGRVSIRHKLNDFLAREGGHIGYAVLPPHRRLGYTTEILRQALIITHEEEIGPVLVTCDDDNVVSAGVIERCGGVLENVVEATGGVTKRRYWFDAP